ncbi:carbohydrate-binding protein [Jeongeupia chitinilytica]|uniref:Chitin-binding type-3 domain-containing protein n=1 Tax=Jeongeupia chitinilytica TaxID=1041641 RepID=A0ABQ3GV96_9NEIS|nr:carbohydrate-binding protein [Jeongeupia chitinilytica]GHD56630.1 hypothetical protein GCM10007350_04120 [Jeongeupia chitinilytica]
MQRLALALIATFASTAALACTPPLPDYFTFDGTRPTGQSAKLPLIPPLTDGGHDYVCNMYPYGGGWHYFNYLNTAIVHGLTDSEWQATGLVTLPPQAPAWQAGSVYNKGDRVSHLGADYEARWWTQNEAPGSAWGAWQPVDPNGLSPWSAGRTYASDEKAVHAGAVWRAKWPVQGEVPGASEWGAWARTDEAPLLSEHIPPRFSVSYTNNDGVVSVSMSSVLLAQPAAPARLEVRDGDTVLWQTNRFYPLDKTCSPADSHCTPGVYTRADGSFVLTNLKQWLSAWLCNGANECRPSQATRFAPGITMTGHTSEPFPKP